jgi:hypothetical protein
MADETAVPFTAGLPETVLPAPPPEASKALAAALELPVDRQPAAVAEVAAAYPRFLSAWAQLAELAVANGDPVASYAYARVGYHRGLDAARGAGWRGSGYVRWRYEDNRGFLRSLDALRRAAEAIGETDEAERCLLFLQQLDPDWNRR